jgi:hypothetical protein
MLLATELGCLYKALWLQAGNKLFINGRYAKIPNTKPHDLPDWARVIEPLFRLLRPRTLDVPSRLTRFAKSWPLPVDGALERRR